MWRQGEEKQQEKSTGGHTYVGAQTPKGGGWLGSCPRRAALGDTQESSLKTKGFAYMSSSYPRFLHGTWTPLPSLFCTQQPEQFLKTWIESLTHAQIKTLRGLLNLFSVPPTSFPRSPHSSHTGVFPVPTPGPAMWDRPEHEGQQNSASDIPAPPGQVGPFYLFYSFF